ncbi:MAG TPA: collagen-binding domain-containing protein, partial [Paracoccaceae bacterium]|nr:collagen-binding domain-containing protein [Paracoccaceae bacterium]
MRILLAALTAMSIGGSAAAATIDAEDMLKSFTVIALGNYELNSHTPGAVYVGGDFKAGHSINGGVSNATVGDANGTLIVGGDIIGGGNTTINGNIAVGGSIMPGTNVNRNNGSIAEGANVPVEDVSTAMRDLSDRLAHMPETGGETMTGDRNNPRLNVGPAGSDGVAVINFGTDDLDLFFGGNPGITFADGPITTIINIAGESFHLESGKNFNDFTGANNVIFNFYEAL